MATEMPANSRHNYDVVIMGGAVAGAATAVLLRRRLPQLRVLVVEKSEAFDWKVGESTVEISSYFLLRELKLYDYLSREQLPKQAFRFWFYNGDVKGMRDASEVGPSQLARVPSFQLDRAKLDEYLLDLAAKEGAEVWRPSRVSELDLATDTGAPRNRLLIERGSEKIEVEAGWVVDATGRAALIARKKKMLHPLQEHPIAAVWARFRNIKDLDGYELAGDPADPFVRFTVGARRLATNHFTGYGYWIWFIPLKGGETSVGLVWDKRLVDPPGANPQDKLLRFLDTNPLTRELIAPSQIVPDDARMYGHLPYLVDHVAGVGWSLVGDAAGFLDPFYSPGLDQMAYSVSWSVELIRRNAECTDRAKFAAEVALHDKRYGQYLPYLFRSIYKDKYYSMGDYDTMSIAFLLDTAMYYFALVIPLYRWSSKRMLQAPFYDDHSAPAMRVMSFYQRRLMRIAERKKQLGIYGRRNAGMRPSFVGFSLRSSNTVMFAHGLLRWAKAEWFHAWSYVFRPKPMSACMPVSEAPVARETPAAVATGLSPSS